MRRMVIDYTQQYYLPAAVGGAAYDQPGYATAKAMVAWRNALQAEWPTVRVSRGQMPGGPVTVGDAVPLTAKVWLGSIAPDQVAVELVTGPLGGDGQLHAPTVIAMQLDAQDGDARVYRVAYQPTHSGPQAVGVRVRASHPAQLQPIEPGLIRWA